MNKRQHKKAIRGRLLSRNRAARARRAYRRSQFERWGWIGLMRGAMYDDMRELASPVFAQLTHGETVFTWQGSGYSWVDPSKGEP